MSSDSGFPVSESQRYRELGNEHFRSATAKYCASVQEQRLQKAFFNYSLALETGESEEEKASAAKNLALVCWKLSRVSRCPKTTIDYYRKEAMQNFSQAWELGMFSKDKDWRAVLKETWFRYCDDMLTVLTGEYDLRERSQRLHELLSVCRSGAVKPKIYLHLAQNLFAAGADALKRGEFKTCLSCMHECHNPLEQVLQIGSEEDKTEAELMKAEVLMTLSIGESAQELNKGDQFLKMALSEGTKESPFAWDAIDCYRSAIIFTRELDIEREATAYSKLAQTYHKALKVRAKAKEYALHTIRLAEVLGPKNFQATYGWYREATQILEFYQSEDLRVEESKWENKRKPILDELSRELSEINSSKIRDSSGSVNIREFLRLVYAKFPPKHKGTAILSGDPSKMDYPTLFKCLKRSIIQYHPDTIDESVHGIRYKVLCEEIYKVICNQYNTMKGIE